MSYWSQALVLLLFWLPSLKADSLMLDSLGSGPLLMTSGNTYSFLFNNIGSVTWSSISPVAAPNSSGFYINSYAELDALVSPPDSWTVRMYQTPTVADVNLFAILGNTASYTTTNPYGWSLNDGVSSDSGGAMQISMIAGTAYVIEVGIKIVKDGSLYQKIFAFAVPEPSVNSLLVVGGLVLFANKRKR